MGWMGICENEKEEKSFGFHFGIVIWFDCHYYINFRLKRQNGNEIKKIKRVLMDVKEGWKWVWDFLENFRENFLREIL